MSKDCRVSYESTAPTFTSNQTSLSANLVFLLYTVFSIACALFYNFKQAKKYKDKVRKKTNALLFD